MARAISAKFHPINPPKKSESYRFYALEKTTPRVNFLLNTGDIGCPREVPVLDPKCLDDQLNIQATEYLSRGVRIDIGKRTVYLPKICETYRDDFTSVDSAIASGCLRYCLNFLDEEIVASIKRVLELPGATVKFNPTPDQFHATFTEYITDTPTDEIIILTGDGEIECASALTAAIPY
jgi:hypothetical protein